MKRWLPVVVIVAQVGLLGFMAGEREWVAKTGTEISLRTAPIDPRDPMRGDYVRLDYEVAQVPRRLCHDGVEAWFDEVQPYGRKWRDHRVYAELQLRDEGIAEVISISDQKPSGGLFLRGRVASISGNSVQVRYGVEAFFMEQGTAREFEDQLRREKLGVPVNALVAVGGNGLAVLTGYRWEPLGITLTFDWEEREADPPNQRPTRSIVGITVQLKNHSEEPVAVVDRDGGGSFRLVRNERWNPNQYRWVGEESSPPGPSAAEVVVLQPGKTHETFLDVTKPPWFVTRVDPGEGKGPLPMSALETNWTESFLLRWV
jgi:uncharacterized membrane-anchored protein